MTGIFTVSLDFELHWGVFDKRDRDSRMLCYKNTLARVIPKMLSLFKKHGVHATWATVGSVFAQNADEWKCLSPVEKPEYINAEYSPYEWIKTHHLQPEYYNAHFAPETVSDILQHENQELGTHTFSHYYCLEETQNSGAFAADLMAANNAASKFKTQTTSLIFPRNQYNAAALKMCCDNGIKVVRSNPASGFWSPINDQDAGLLRKVLRTGDAYIKLSRRTSYPLSAVAVKNYEPLQLPASRFLRPWHPKERFVNKLKLRRIINEMYAAAKHNECYHLWWHPENFGDYPQENLDNLTILLEQYKKCVNKHGMQSWNMNEYVEFFAD